MNASEMPVFPAECSTGGCTPWVQEQMLLTSSQRAGGVAIQIPLHPPFVWNGLVQENPSIIKLSAIKFL